jgi:exoribonuclease-2
MERIGAAEAVAGSVSRAERMAEEHWTLVYLLQHPDWRGEAILVDKWDHRGRLLIPALGLEDQMQLRRGWSLNSTVELRVTDVDLPRLRATFRVV